MIDSQVFLFRSTREDTEDKGVEIRYTGRDDGHVLSDLNTERCSPVVVCEVRGVDVAVEVDELGYYADDDSGRD